MTSWHMGALAAQDQYKPTVGNWDNTLGPPKQPTAQQRWARINAELERELVPDPNMAFGTASTTGEAPVTEEYRDQSPTEPWEFGLAAVPVAGRIAGAVGKVGSVGAGIYSSYNSEARADARGKTLKKMGDILSAKPQGATSAVPQGVTMPAPANWPPHVSGYVDNPQRMHSPGIYKDPRDIASEAAANVAPEHPALKDLFGVTRDDLWEIGERGTRQGNMEPSFQTKPGAKGSYMSDAIMTEKNAQRQIDALTEARKYPDLAKGMESWYVMDPAFHRLVELVGREQAIKEYNRFNTVVPMFSPASDVEKEINRGTVANMMIARGQWPKFVRHGGTAVGDRGPRFPKELRDLQPHPYHSTAHTGPVGRYLETGDASDMKSVKVPLYMQASGVPETGFQTSLPIPDAHITRSAGMSDVRKSANPGVSMKTPEYMQWGPWYRDKVAKPLGLEAVPAQGLQWGTYAPQTGVNTPIGAPKLEILSKMIWERAMRLGIDPKLLRDKVLRGQDHSFLSPAMGDVADSGKYA